MDAAVEVSRLLVRRGGAEVLRSVDCVVPRGLVGGLLGPSGSGKTTFMRALVGVQVVESGRVTVLGEEAGSPGLRARVGYVTQSPSVYPDLTVRANVGYFAALHGAGSAAADRAVSDVGLAAAADQLVAELSGGQRSRASLACALVGDPELLVLDEPTVGLDPVLREDLWGMFHDLAGAGTTLIVSSHVMDEADRCDRLWLLREGRFVVAGDSPSRVLATTGAHDLEGAFLQLARGQAS